MLSAPPMYAVSHPTAFDIGYGTARGALWLPHDMHHMHYRFRQRRGRFLLAIFTLQPFHAWKVQGKKTKAKKATPDKKDKGGKGDKKKETKTPVASSVYMYIIPVMAKFNVGMSVD